MASAWVDKRTTGRGEKRYRVRYRLGGGEGPILYGGSFRRHEDALRRRAWIIGEMAAMRVPDVRQLAAPERKPVLGDAATGWIESRVDVPEQTRAMHRSAFGRIFKLRPKLRGKRVDEITVQDVADLVAALHAAGYRRETLRKTRTVLAQTLDFYEVRPNPPRDDRVKLPYERRRRLPVPLAEHVEQVVSLVSRDYVLPLLIADECGPRVSELTLAVVGDLDEERSAIRLREETTKQGQARYLRLPPALFKALVATLPPREDRDLEAPLFPGLTDANLRMAINSA